MAETVFFFEIVNRLDDNHAWGKQWWGLGWNALAKKIPIHLKAPRSYLAGNMDAGRAKSYAPLNSVLTMYNSPTITENQYKKKKLWETRARPT